MQTTERAHFVSSVALQKKVTAGIPRFILCVLIAAWLSQIFNVSLQLLEPGVSNQLVDACGVWLQKHHYTELVDERAVGHLCGYPCCANPIDTSKYATQRHQRHPTLT